MSSPGQRLDSEQSEFKIKYTNFGMQGLEYVLGNGFPEDSVYILIGPPGTFYTTFAQQALYNRVISRGKVAYYTVEVPSTDIEQDMATFGWRVRDYVDDGTWNFVRPIPPQLQTFVELMPEIPYEERVQLSSSSLAALTQNFLTKLKDGRWTATNISYLLNVYPLQEITNLMMFMVNAAHRLGGVHFILIPSGAHDEKSITYIKNLVDGVLTFRFAQGFGQAEGEIEIEKVRRMIPRTKLIRYIVQSDGISIETTARIG